MPELHRTPCTLYGPNGEIISEGNPLPVQLEGESKVVIAGEPTVKIAPAEANKEVAIQNKITVANIEGSPIVKAEGETAPGTVLAGNPVPTSIVDSENKVRSAKGNTEGIAFVQAAGRLTVGTAISVNPINISGIDGESKVRNLLTNAEGKLQIEIVNKPAVTVEGEPKIKPEGQTAPGSALVGKPIPIAGVDGGGLVRTLLTGATGILQVEGIAGATASIEGKIAAAAEQTSKPVGIGGIDAGKLARNILTNTSGELLTQVQGEIATGVEDTKNPVPVGIIDAKKLLRKPLGDEAGVNYVAPFNPEHQWSLTKEVIEKNETFEVAAVAGYRYVLTTISVYLIIGTALAASKRGTVGFTDNATEVLKWAGSNGSVLTSSSVFTVVNLTGNPIYIAKAVNTPIKIGNSGNEFITLMSIAGYMIKG